MDLVPASWADAGLDTATLLDRAPWAAVAAAIEERAAVAPGYLLAGHATRLAPRPGTAPGADWFVAAAQCIRELQRAFVNPATPYAASAFWTWPDFLASQYLAPPAGLAPFDAMALLPPVPHPMPADSAASAAARAFLAWARSSLDAMAVRDASAWTSAPRGSYTASGSWTSLSAAAAAATLDPSATGSDCSWTAYVSPVGVDVTSVSFPAGVRVENRTPVAGRAKLVFCAPIPPPLDVWRPPGMSWTFGVFDAFGVAAAPGVSTTGVDVAAGRAVEILADPDSCPAPAASVPQPPPGGYGGDVVGGARLFSLIDYSETFRFHGS